MTYENHHYHLAPTADIVKLLRELETEADAKWVRITTAPNNVVNCEFYSHYIFERNELELRAIFKINGEKIIVDHKIQDFDNKLELIDAFISTCITRIVMKAINTSELQKAVSKAFGK